MVRAVFLAVALTVLGLSLVGHHTVGHEAMPVHAPEHGEHAVADADEGADDGLVAAIATCMGLVVVGLVLARSGGVLARVRSGSRPHLEAQHFRVRTLLRPPDTPVSLRTVLRV